MTVMVMKITYIMLAHLGDIMHAQPVRLHMADVAHEARHEPKHVARTEPMGLTTDVTANVAAASGSSSGSRRICAQKRAEELRRTRPNDLTILESCGRSSSRRDCLSLVKSWEDIFAAFVSLLVFLVGRVWR